MDGELSGSDRRKFTRVKATFIVVYKIGYPLQVRMTLGEKEIHAVMLDLSEEGVALVTNHSIPVSTLLLMKFILVNEMAETPDERVRPMEIAGDVRYSIPGERNEYRVGICFTQIAEADRYAIANFVKDIQ